jgi:undecaprenyl-diphosphatase
MLSPPAPAIKALRAPSSRARRCRRGAVFGILEAALTGETLTVAGSKAVIGRRRPNISRLVDASGYSFPSRHSAHAAAMFAAFALIVSYGRSTAVRTLLFAAASAIAAMVAATRVLLGVTG